MYNAININAAVEYIKNIVDNSRCTVCDKTGGIFLRYGCGHCSCGDCIALAVDCSVCLTPPQSSSNEPVVDNTLTLRAVNAVNLLNVFQNEFHIDVYKRQRISEQLRVEKEVFPECIQAPIKYSNSRKTLNNSKHNKENILSQLPGEEISPISNHKMEKQSENVEKWLKKYVRKPFADLNSNDERLTRNTKAIIDKNVERETTTVKKSSRKRQIKTACSTVKSQSLIVDHLVPINPTAVPKKKPKIGDKIIKPDTSKYNTGPTRIYNAHENDEIITIDDKSTIIIDDSQIIREDKDLNAWLAVQKAEHNKKCTSSEMNKRSKTTEKKIFEVESKLTNKVPFYLKSNLTEECKCNYYCRESNEQFNTHMRQSNCDSGINNTESPIDVSITVENQSFVACITVQQVVHNPRKTNMQSVEVQTDKVNTVHGIHENVENINCYEKQSLDIFQDDGKIIENADCHGRLQSLNKTDNVVIQESDSDEDIQASVSMQVTAEIHRSCEEMEYGILADINEIEEHAKRTRRGPRGFTPTSTDSSEKENYNPNRIKKKPSLKKKQLKNDKSYTK